ncbi:MAG: hypothetical protein QOE84_720 [Actinomycetota bacterium]|jgi:hypothetical protein|nr:hypothetical protein [Actinomycetota bacterium]
MALSGEQWLQTQFFPVVDSLPAASSWASQPSSSASQPSSSASPLAAISAIAAIRLLGAVDALVAVGVLDDEQQRRCRAAMEPKGVTSEEVTVSSFSLVSGFAQASGGEAAPKPVDQPDRIVRVLADGHVFGLVDGEQAVLICVEVWQRSVRASFLIAVSPAAEHERSARTRQMRDWFLKKQAGEATDADRPAMSTAQRHPGAAASWLLDADGQSTQGAVVAGQGGSDWWRVDVQWDVAVGENCRELHVSATEDRRLIGRSVLGW